MMCNQTIISNAGVPEEERPAAKTLKEPVETTEELELQLAPGVSESEYELSDDDSDDDLSDDEEEEDDSEMLDILKDAKRLRSVAAAFLHPEVPVPSTVCDRCYFDRPSALPQIHRDDADEIAAIVSDASALSRVATDYAHPERSVKTVDSLSFGRNYFNRPSAPHQSLGEINETIAIAADADKLRRAARNFLHPELACVPEDSTLFGRNYFNRASAPNQSTRAEEEEKSTALKEAASMKKLAVDYLHPEKPVVTTDSALFGRNYFHRASAPDEEMFNEAEEKAAVLTEAVVIKKLALDYLHPERPVETTDSTVFGRNYFHRASAPDEEILCGAEEEEAVLAEAAALKKLAVDYMHPEMPVETTDATIFGRNYFHRASAPDAEKTNGDELLAILSEAAAMKKLAVDYLHPEMPVETTDSTVFGRNYFHRASAPDEEMFYGAEEKAAVLVEAAALKKLAVDYLHPEMPVETTDSTIFGRNYFHRASAPDEEMRYGSDERVAVLVEAAALKKLAVDYLHPEMPVETTDATIFGRNYFHRASAPDEEVLAEAEEKAAVLAEAASMKKLAVDYAHPERPIETTDSTVFGRNYFHRASAYRGFREDERDEVIADALLLKLQAAFYLHPEIGVETTDPFAYGRNYFCRPSAAGVEDMITCTGSKAQPSEATNRSDLQITSSCSLLHGCGPAVSITTPVRKSESIMRAPSGRAA